MAKKTSTEEFQKKEGLYHYLFENPPVGIRIADKDESTIDFNKSTLDFNGLI